MDKKYKKNYLTDVIVRIDFLNPIEKFKTELNKNLINVIKKYFPIAEPQEILTEKYQLKSGKPQKKGVEKTTKWSFFSRGRNMQLVITSHEMFINAKKYDSYKKLNEPFTALLNKLFSEYKELDVRRLGLRYINTIELYDKMFFNWNRYLNKDLLSIFNLIKKKMTISSAFHNLEFNYGDFNLKFQYGMHNPDYPAQIRKKIFILDYDAYYAGILKKDDIIKLLPDFRKKIKELFEKSITDDMRKKLNG